MTGHLQVFTTTGSKEDAGKISKEVVNIIEDGRIEELGKKRFQGNRLAIDFSNSFWLKKRPKFKDLKKWQIFIEAILEMAVLNGIKEPINDDYLKKLVYTASFYIYWAKKQDNSKLLYQNYVNINPKVLNCTKIYINI